MISLADSDRAAIRRAAARHWPKHGSGKQPMPAYVVAEMWADYERTHSLRQTGRNFQRTEQALSLLFRAHGLTPSWHAKPGPKGESASKNRNRVFQRVGNGAVDASNCVRVG